jgi:subfamily B ATP-binding cassette protein MsbA
MTRPYWPRVFGGIVLSLIVSAIKAGIAWAVKPAVNMFVEQRYSEIKSLPIAVFLLFVMMGLFEFCQSYLMKSAGLKLVRETRNRLFNHILYLPISYFGRESSGVIISRVMNDVEMLKEIIANILRNTFVSIPTALFLFGVAFYRRWDLTLIIVLLMPFLAYSTKKFGRRVKTRRKEAQKNLSFLTQRLGESIIGSRIIKVFNRESTVAGKFISENGKYYRDMLRVVRFKEFTRLITEVVTGFGIAFIIWYGGKLVVDETITPGDFVSIIAAIMMVFSPLKKIIDSYNLLQEVRAATERIDTLFDAEHEVREGKPVKQFISSLKFEHVFFSYPGKETEVIHDLDLDVKHGEIVAIVGKSGAGKSTLVDLIPRYMKPSRGAITLDGTDINDLDLQDLRELIGTVSQDVLLFNDTVYENIAFGRPDARREQVREAARLAYADEFIDELPDTYETVIGERGLKLSGGQRQRIAIARAILKNPPILILDEATSSLDNVSEALVQKALETLMKGRTTIVIAHRLSTIRNVDRIIVLDNGTITDTGTHDELMTRSDTYMKLYNAMALS